MNEDQRLSSYLYSYLLSSCLYFTVAFHNPRLSLGHVWIFVSHFFQKSAQTCLLLPFFSNLPSSLSLTQERSSWNYSMRSHQLLLLPFPINTNSINILQWHALNQVGFKLSRLDPVPPFSFCR